MTGENREDQQIEKRDEVTMRWPDSAATPVKINPVEPVNIDPARINEDLLARAKRGDQTAFADLVRQQQSMVCSIANNFFRDRALAEDIAQEVFLHLYQNIASIESSSHLKFWLRKVTGHRCIDHSRKYKMQTVSVDDTPELPQLVDGAGLPDAPDGIDTMMQNTLRRMVATLPEKPRLVVTLRYQEDMDPTEIAEILEMPLNTVKSHLRRSLAILREKMSRAVE